MSEELIKVVNFEGFISHVSESGEGSEVIIYVAHVVSDDTRNSMEDESAPLNLHNNIDATDPGKLFTIRVGQCVERVATKSIEDNARLTKVHLIDKGIDVEVERNALFPSTSQIKITTDCMCPVLVVDAGEEQRKIAMQVTGRKCRCIEGNLVVIPSVGLCVKGRLLVLYEKSGYAELKDVTLIPGGERAEGTAPQLSVDTAQNTKRPRRRYEFSARCRRPTGADGRYDGRNEYSDLTGMYENDAYILSIGRNADRWDDQLEGNSTTTGNSAYFASGRRLGDTRTDSRDHDERDDKHAVVPRPCMPYIQHAFKEYEPHVYPSTKRIRFDKADSSSVDTFWAFDPSTFTTVERALHEGRQRYGGCPQFDAAIVHELKGMGCLVRVSVDSGCRSLCRAEIIKFADSTQRFSVYLVDYGFYKWIRYNDVFNISSISKKDEVLSLPVALLHCRLQENAGSGIRLQQLEQGGEYMMVINSRDAEGIFNVLVERIDSGLDTQARDRCSLVPASRDKNSAGRVDLCSPWCSVPTLQYTNETLARAFDRNMGLGETMSCTPPSNTVMGNCGPFPCWHGFCGFAVHYPMVLPVLMPVVPCFGGVAGICQQCRFSTHFGQGDGAFVQDSVAMNGNVRITYSRGEEGRQCSCVEGEHRSFERSGDHSRHSGFGVSGNRDMQTSSNVTRYARCNNGWGGGMERTATAKDRRLGRRSFHYNAFDASAARRSSHVENLDVATSRKNDCEEKGKPITFEGSSEWDLPPPRNRRNNRFTCADNENESEMNPK